MLTKKIFVVVATAFLGLSMAVGCAAPEAEEPNARSEDPLAYGNPGDLGDFQPAGELSQQAPKPSPVECEGHQDEDGRICCDATHCCINIKGVINCKLPPKEKKWHQWAVANP